MAVMALALAVNVIYKIAFMPDDSAATSLDTGKTAGSAKMRPRARLISVIGDELISDEPVAAVELVKNAYDADARKVTVRFEAGAGSPERLIVVDDGHGMSLRAVLDSWFEPGTATKRKGGKSPGGRPFQGAKGIGRFAAARLAHHLFLQSRMPDSPEAVYVLLDWGKFDEESYLDEITVDYETRAASISPGTQLTLDGLRKQWEDSDFDELHARLSRLISPFEEIRDFEIELDIPARPDLSGTVEPPQLLLQPRYLLKGDLDATGSFSGEFQLDGITTTSFANRKIGGTGVVPEKCGPFSIEIRAWDRDREGLEPIADRTDQSIGQIRRTLNAYCGVSIYRDGFRVHPYGEKGNDWLNLDLRSRQTPGKRLANNQIVGAIQISRDKNVELKDRSTREGLVINPAYHEFQEWFMEIISLLEEARYPLRPKREVSTKADPIFESFDLTAARSAATAALGAEHPVTKSIIEAERQVIEGVERIQEMFSRLLMSAGLGQMVDIVIHEIGAPLGKINRELVALEKKAGVVYPPTVQSEIWDMCTRIKSWLVQIQSLRQRLDPQTPAKRGRASTFNVRLEIEDNFHLYAALITRQKIRWNIEPEGIAITATMSRAALGQMMANLIDNSVFWLVRHHGIGGGGRIAVRLEPLPKGFRLHYSDDGAGIPEADRAQIFEPYFTTRPNGMGLGLYIARLVIEPHGMLTYGEECDLPGACFHALFENVTAASDQQTDV